MPEPLTPVTTQRTPSGNVDVDLLEVVPARPGQARSAPVGGAVGARGRRPSAAREEVAGGRARRRRRSPPGGPRRATRPPASPAPGPMSTSRSAARMIASSCSTTTTELPASRSRCDDRDQAADVARVQADRRLVQHVERVDQPRAERRRQGHALRLAAREGPRRAVERQVVQPDPVEVVEPASRTWSRTRRATGFARRVGRGRRGTRAASPIVMAESRGDVEPADLDGQRLGPEPGPAAGGAGASSPAIGSGRPGRASCTTSTPAAGRTRAGPGSPCRGRPRRSAAPARASVARTARRSAGRAPGRASSRSCELAAVGRGRPGGDRAVAERLRRVGDDPAEVEVDDPAEPLARRAGAERAVVAEEPGVGLEVIEPAARAAPALVEGQRLGLGDRPGTARAPWRRPSRSSRAAARAPREPRTRRSTTTSIDAVGRHRAGRPAVERDRPGRRPGPGRSRPRGGRRPGRRGRTRGGPPAGRRPGSGSPRAGRRSPRTTVAGSAGSTVVAADRGRRPGRPGRRAGAR